MSEKFVEITEFGTEKYHLICDYCGKKLAEVYRNGSAYQVFITSECEHYTWRELGNACYENPDSEICRETEKLLERAVRVYQQGTSIHLLIRT